MNSLVSWQLMLFLCATSFRETFEKVAPMENPLSTGQRLGSQALLAPWEQSPRCAERNPAGAQPNARGASLCPPPESAAPRSRLIPAPRGAVLVQREKDLSAYNWNSFGLRYGKRQTAPPGSVRGGRCAWLSAREVYSQLDSLIWKMMPTTTLSTEA